MKQFAYAHIINEEGKVLLLKRPPDKKVNPSFWNFPGGKIEVGEDAKETLIREIKEEIGCEIRVVGSKRQMVDKDYNLDITVFMVKIISDKIKLSDEHVEYRWVNPSEIKEMQVMPYISKMFKGS